MKTNTQGTILKFNPKAKTVVAVAMTDAQETLYMLGSELGAMIAESDLAWTHVLRLCKNPADRKCVRAGFVPTYMGAKGCSEKSAQDRFDYLARKHSPQSSRKKAGRVAKSVGRKEKTATGVAEQVNASAIAQRLAAVLHYVAAAQAKHMGDGDMLEVLGEIAAIAGGKAK